MNVIDGQHRESRSGAHFESRNPADVNDLVGLFPDSGSDDASDAVHAARRAFGAWAQVTAAERADVFSRAAQLIKDRVEDLAAAVTREQGKPLPRARGEVLRAAETLNYLSGSALRPMGEVIPSSRPGVRLYTRREPIGPVLAITPFNFPVLLSVLKLGAAAVAGNTVVWKPSPYVPGISVLLMEAFMDAGLPDGVVNLVLGSAAALGQCLVDDQEIRAISFTGSTSVGLQVGIVAAQRHVRSQLELGGKNALAIGPDVQPDRAAELAVESAFGESGQKCTAAGVVIVPRGKVNDILGAIEARISSLGVGNGINPNTAIGPLISKDSVARARDLVDRSLAAGARRVIADVAPSVGDLEHGHFLDPQVLSVDGGAAPIVAEETFAPVLAVLASDDVVRSVTHIARSTNLGLSASIITNDLALSERFVSEVDAGLVNVNLPTTGIEMQAPFGGWNLSGGPFPEAGPSALEFFTRVKTVSMGFEK